MTHMKAIRNVIIILLLFIIFVFVFAGQGTFDKYLPLSEIKGAMIRRHGKRIRPAGWGLYNKGKR